jgi:hypothetical protein
VYVVQPVKCLWFATIALVAACNLQNDGAIDPKDETFAYIVDAVLKPNCGTAECHSASKAERGDIFDSQAGAKASFDKYGLVAACADMPPCPLEASANSYLYRILSTGVESVNGKGDRMPLDQAMSNSNIVLIRDWIDDGAEGYQIPGAP